MAVVKVAWQQGTEVGAEPMPKPKKPKCSDLVAAKSAVLEADISKLEKLPGHGKLAEYQRRRLRWLEWAGKATAEHRAQRMREIEADLGEEGMRYLDAGLPEQFHGDRRFVDQLSEYALIRYVQRGE